MVGYAPSGVDRGAGAGAGAGVVARGMVMVVVLMVWVRGRGRGKGVEMGWRLGIVEERRGVSGGGGDWDRVLLACWGWVPGEAVRMSSCCCGGGDSGGDATGP